MSRALRRSIAWLVLAALLPPSAWALQKTVRCKSHHYDEAPVGIQRSSVTMIETYFSPTQLPVPGGRVKQTRVRYANRAGLTPSSFVLKGAVTCRNQSRKEVEAMELSVVILDAFHRPILNAGQAEPVTVIRLPSRIPSKAEQQLSWEQQVESVDVYEVAVILTRVRFSDGSLWEAPAEELIDIF
jgi:hypothetical protein